MFPAMGGTVDIHLDTSDASAATRVEALFASHERALSRFRHDSELSALNASGGSAFHASALLFDIVRQALAAAHATSGTFDLTVIEALKAAGYTRSWPFAVAPTVMSRPGLRTASWAAIELDAETSTIRLPADVRIDLGGIGKGYTVDAAITLLRADGCANALVNAAGDLYALGSDPDDETGDGWVVGVHHPLTPEDDDIDVATLRVRDRGVATSGSTRRRWLVGGERYHHLIDARTGRPFDSDMLTVTVVAPTATTADVLAKTAFLLGADDGLRAIADFDAVDALAVTTEGDLLMTAGMGAYVVWRT